MADALRATGEDWPMEDRLRRARINAGYRTPAEFALVSGISKSTVCNAESGRHAPSRLVITAWAATTGKTVGFLVTGDATVSDEDAYSELARRRSACNALDLEAA